MHLSVVTNTQSCSIEASEDLELHLFKALCEAELQIPCETMTLSVNGNILIDDNRTLNQLGVKDGDLVMVSTETVSAPTQQIPDEVAQFDFSNITVPSAYRVPNQSSASGSNDRQREENKEDPDVIHSMLKSNPEQLSRLSHSNPVLAAAVNKGLEEFKKVLNSQQEAKLEKERQRIRMLTADPFDSEAQQMIAKEIQKQNIDANMEAAMEYNPESFGTVQMLYVNCSVNGFPVKAFIDSGAQTTIMSEKCAQRCNIMRLVDHRWSGIAKGVGTQKIIGRVHMVQLDIGGVYLASSFSILEEQPMDMLLGLDMLKRHQMVIDLQENVLKISTSNTSTPFLSESELPECAKLTSRMELKEEQALKDSYEQAKAAEDQEMARALAESSKESEQMEIATTSGSSSSSAVPAASDADIAEIMALGFSREEAVTELTRHNNDKTNAMAALFAKRFSN